ncbi:MAG: excisionase family DNA-binding protein [Chloroflexota bacterium]|nr:excisionase family DNA-binding protein [Chloroflexota bacterium]
MSAITAEGGPIAAASLDQSRYAEIERQLSEIQGVEATIVGADGRRVELPEPLLRVLREAASALARDRAVDVVPIPKQLTILQAAHQLGVPRAYLEQLLDEGALPSSGTGTRRRVALADLMAYAERRDKERRDRLDRLTQMGQELGLYSAE